MPVLWKYLLRNYLKVLLLSLTSFIAVLLVMRFHEIAKFAALGSDGGQILYFILLQIPYILPLALPISCMIASLLLFIKLSESSELTALRASGIGLSTLYSPILIMTVLLMAGNFVIASELTPFCRAKSKALIGTMTAINPLVLLQKDSSVKPKHIYADMEKMETGKYAKNAIIVMRNHANNRLGIMTAKKLSLKAGLLNGENVTFISSVKSDQPNDFDHLVLENQKTMTTRDSILAQFSDKMGDLLNNDYLSMRMLLAKLSLKEHFLKKKHDKTILEVVRRIALSLSVFSFSCIGMGYGIHFGRRCNSQKVRTAIFLGGALLISFIAAKSMQHTLLPIVIALYFLPHPLIIALSLRAAQRTARGEGL